MINKRLIQIKKFYRKHRRLPTYSEMLKLFNLSSKKAVHDVVYKLVDQGFFYLKNNKLTPTTRFFGLPLLGLVKAGFPILAEEDKQYLTLDEYLIENPSASFLLRVSGDSLIDIGIFDGDIVVVDQKKSPLPGDIVLAEIDKEWTLKIYKKDRRTKKIYLQAANPTYPPLYPKQQLIIHGVVKGLIRKIVR